MNVSERFHLELPENFIGIRESYPIPIQELPPFSNSLKEVGIVLLIGKDLLSSRNLWTYCETVSWT
jgi:hypothetical protein